MQLFLSRFLCFLFLVFALITKAQQPQCGTDQYIAEILKTNPELLRSITEYNEQISNAGKNDNKLNKKGTTRTIPVVFHVIHAYGTENISKAQIEDQIRIMNEAYQRLNADTTATRSAFKSVAADMDVEFKLARKDPAGNCTEGITRTFSYLTDGGDDAVKNLIRWDYRKYLNVWVVKNIVRDAEAGGRVLGYATLPAFTNSTSDGIVVLADYIGSIGTGATSGNKGRVMVHEAGHWLGLYHPFQNGCGGQCHNSGDYICDTPPVSEPSFGCPTTNNTCNNDFPDQVDMVENYMDYANGSCQNMFTKGQKAVVDVALGNSSYRAQNISAGAHTATGVFTNPACTAIADFNTSNNLVTVCEGGTVNFKDYSYNGALSMHEWTFDGGSPATSGSTTPAITYPTAGLYKVSLKVTNGTGSNTKTKDKMIHVIQTVSDVKAPVNEGFDNTLVLNSTWKAWETGEYGWKRITTTKYDGTAGVVVNIDQGTANNSLYTMVSEAYDVSVLNGRVPKLRFRTAYRPAVDGNSEILTVALTKDCGKTWIPIKSYSTNTNLGVDKVAEQGWKPTTQAHWKEQVIDLANYQTTKNLMIKFEARSRSGNSIYLDDMNIKPDIAGANHMPDPEHFSINIYPNPSKETVSIVIETEGRAFGGIKIFNSTGQYIENSESTMQKNGSEINYTARHLQPGIYFARVSIEGQTIVKKFVVIP